VADDVSAAHGAVVCHPFRICPENLRDWTGSSTQVKECTMGKTGRKRRARKKKGANHGKRPNA
jgi:hypothetical protein